MCLCLRLLACLLVPLRKNGLCTARTHAHTHRGRQRCMFSASWDQWADQSIDRSIEPLGTESGQNSLRSPSPVRSFARTPLSVRPIGLFIFCSALHRSKFSTFQIFLEKTLRHAHCHTVNPISKHIALVSHVFQQQEDSFKRYTAIRCFVSSISSQFNRAIQHQGSNGLFYLCRTSGSFLVYWCMSSSLLLEVQS